MVDRQDRMPRAIRKRNGMHQTSGKAGDLPQVEAACVPCSCSSLPPRGSVRLDWCLCCHVRRSLFHLTSPLRIMGAAVVDSWLGADGFFLPYLIHFLWTS